MVGNVRTTPLNIDYIEAGVIAVLKTNTALNIVTVKSINAEGQLIVMGTNNLDDYLVPSDAKLCKLVVVVNKLALYPLKFNQWANAINNNEVDTDKSVTFELVTQKFKPGKYVQTCFNCTINFLGAKNQIHCKQCISTKYTAKILITKEKVKPKRPRLISPYDAKKIAYEAYNLGIAKTSGLDFESWLEKQF